MKTAYCLIVITSAGKWAGTKREEKGKRKENLRGGVACIPLLLFVVVVVIDGLG